MKIFYHNIISTLDLILTLIKKHILGPTSSLTVAAQRMMQRCFEKLAEKEEQFMKLEKQINPLLDDNDQVSLF